MTKHTAPKLTKKERKQQRRDTMVAKGLDPLVGENIIPEPWNDLDVIYNTLIELLKDATELINYLKIKEIQTHLNKLNAVIDSQTISLTIIEIFSPNLPKIRQAIDNLRTRSDNLKIMAKADFKDDKEGLVKLEEEKEVVVMESVSVFEALTELNNTYSKLIQPVCTSLAANIEQAYTKYLKDLKQEQTEQTPEQVV